MLHCLQWLPLNLGDSWGAGAPATLPATDSTPAADLSAPTGQPLPPVRIRDECYDGADAAIWH